MNNSKEITWKAYWSGSFPKSWSEFDDFCDGHPLLNPNKSIWEQDETMLVGALSNFLHSKKLKMTPLGNEQIKDAVNILNGAPLLAIS